MIRNWASEINFSSFGKNSFSFICFVLCNQPSSRFYFNSVIDLNYNNLPYVHNYNPCFVYFFTKFLRIISLFSPMVSIQEQIWQAPVSNQERVIITRSWLETSYDRNLVSVSATETKINFRYRSLNFCYLNRNYLHILFFSFFHALVPYFEHLLGYTQVSWSLYVNYQKKN